MEASTPSHRIHFGKFEVDPDSGELLKEGRLVHLQGQPIQILLMLLERPDRIVTREELQQRLWPGDTFVDFNHSLNAAIQRLREALSDSADTPRYIETLPRLVGLRLFHLLRPKAAESKTDSALQGAVDSSQEGRGTVPGAKRLGRRVAWIGLIAGILLGISLTGWHFYSKRSVIPPLRVRKLTSFRGVETNPAFSPDGNQVAFCWNGEKQDNFDIYIQLIDGGKTLRLTTNPAEDREPAWSPDGRRIAFNRYTPEGCEILIIPALGGEERKLGMTESADWTNLLIGKMSWSPDGKFLAITENNSSESTSRICLISTETAERQPLTSPSRRVRDSVPIFSPDGKTLAFLRDPIGLLVLSLVDGKASGEPRQLNVGAEDFDWMPDGRGLVFSSNRTGLISLWKIALNGGEPEPLAGISDAVTLSVARQSSRLVYEQSLRDLNIYRIPKPGLDWRIGLKNEPRPITLNPSTAAQVDPQFSPDGKQIAYSTYKEIWTCNVDGANKIQLTDLGTQVVGSPRWSPDGTHISFDSVSNGKVEIYIVPARGGLRRLLTSKSSSAVLPSWSRDGQWIYFASIQTGGWQVWKVPSGGGSAVPVTRHGGWEAFESVDGQWLYYTKDHRFRGVWRLPVGGGEESQVLKQGRAQAWAIVASGIYLSEDEASGVHAIYFYSFATHGLNRLFTMPKGLSFYRFAGNLAVSPDERTVLITALERVESDLMLVENFR